MKNEKFYYAVQDNEQTFTDQRVYEVGVVGCISYHTPLGKGVARMTRPINAHKITWWIEEVANDSCVEFKGKRKDVVWCPTWDDFIDKYLAWFEEFRPKYLFAHSFANDHIFWQRTQDKFGTNRRTNKKTSLDMMFTTNAWKECTKVCTQFLFDKTLSPKFCKILKKRCSFVVPNRSNLTMLMRWYYNDPDWRQPHTSNGDAMELFRLVRLRMLTDGTSLPQSHTLLNHLKTITII